MSDIFSSKARRTIPGWILLILAAISQIADIDAVIQLFQKFGITYWPIPEFLLWSLLVLGLLYFVWLCYFEYMNEPIRQILRQSAIPAVQDFRLMCESVCQKLRANGAVGRLAATGIEDLVKTLEEREKVVLQTFEHAVLPDPRIRNGQKQFAAFLNDYERCIYRLRDAIQAVDFDPRSKGNFGKWKRFDTDLLRTVNGLISQSRFKFIRKELDNSIWRDGLRNYL